jgi:hypothetical protein
VRDDYIREVVRHTELGDIGESWSRLGRLALERGEAVPAVPLLPGAHWGSPGGDDSSGTVSD